MFAGGALSRVQVSIYMTQRIRNLIYRVTARTESRMAVLIEIDAEGKRRIGNDKFPPFYVPQL